MKILIVYYSMYGQVHRTAEAVLKGVVNSDIQQAPFATTFPTSLSMS
jgi:hypothetical protein